MIERKPMVEMSTVRKALHGTESPSEGLETYVSGAIQCCGTTPSARGQMSQL